MTSHHLQHFLLTRFSYRPPTRDRTSGADWDTPCDPLDPRRLEYRFALFEAVCAPNVLAQSTQDFDWVLIIDPDLPGHWRERLDMLVSGRPRTHVHPITAEDDLTGSRWLEEYMSPHTERLLTTVLDDDDLLRLTYVERLQAHVRNLGAGGPSIKTAGTRTSYEWDLFTSSRHPFGTLAEWHRGRWVRSAGFSLLSSASEHDLTCFALRHTLGDIWFESGTVEELSRVMRRRWGPHGHPPEKFHARIQGLQRRLLERGARGDWRTHAAAELFHDVGMEGGFVVQTNHFLNDQGARLMERKPDSVTVAPESFFPGDLRVDWDVLRERAPLFRLSWSRYSEYLRGLIDERRVGGMSRRELLREWARLTSWFWRM